MNACPTSSTVVALERWVELVMESALQVVGVRGQTKTAQGHVVRREEWVVVSEVVATGLVPGFADYPSSTFVGTEQVVVVVARRYNVRDSIYQISLKRHGYISLCQVGPPFRVIGRMM